MSNGLQGRRTVKNAVLYTLYIYTSSQGHIQGGTLEGGTLQLQLLELAPPMPLAACIHV